mmetsp:Transcript_27875/g.66224  ORF Transcript_27875/g.66224 Transcript_27875/m.66224 type:complete len:220 (-) Transcript_27875:3-662(-)
MPWRECLGQNRRQGSRRAPAASAARLLRPLRWRTHSSVTWEHGRRCRRRYPRPTSSFPLPGLPPAQAVPAAVLRCCRQVLVPEARRSSTFGSYGIHARCLQTAVAAAKSCQTILRSAEGTALSRTAMSQQWTAEASDGSPALRELAAWRRMLETCMAQPSCRRLGPYSSQARTWAGRARFSVPRALQRSSRRSVATSPRDTAGCRPWMQSSHALAPPTG